MQNEKRGEKRKKNITNLLTCFFDEIFHQGQMFQAKQQIKIAAILIFKQIVCHQQVFTTIIYEFLPNNLVRNIFETQMKIFLLLTVLISIHQSLYLKEIMNSETALCLDGSPSAIYYSKGDPERILLHFQSGGWCGEPTLSETLQSCYQRSKTEIGSSKKLPNTMTFSYGILSDVQPNYFKNWTRIFLNYCDGAGHQGGTKASIKYKDTNLYFRGENITIERFDYLEKKYGLYSKTKEVVLSGASAGGLAVFFWANYLGEKITKAKYWLIADSGIFLNSPNFKSKKHDFEDSYASLMKLSNQQTQPPTPQCLNLFPENKHMCMFADNLISYITHPLFVVQSLYDSWSIQNILGIDCVSKFELSTCSAQERAFIEEYHQNTSKVLDKVETLAYSNGYWANGCVYHGYTFFGSYNSAKFRIPSDSVNSIDYCIAQWMKSSENVYAKDQQNWPGNARCSNSKQESHLFNQ